MEHLTAQYGETRILEDVDFEVYPGEILAVLGPSGCGKSTLMRHLIGLDKPFSGQVIIDEEPVFSDEEESFDRIRKKIGVLFQSSALIGSMTIGENVALPIREFAPLPPRAPGRLIRMKLCMVNLEGFDNHLPSEISGGMKKRAGLARALALNPKILFLDEPTSGLDPVSSAEIDELILQINRSLETTMVVVTHALDSIFRVAGRSIMLDKEKRGIIASGDPRKLREESTDPRVRRFFNSRTDPGSAAG